MHPTQPMVYSWLNSVIKTFGTLTKAFALVYSLVARLEPIGYRRAILFGQACVCCHPRQTSTQPAAWESRSSSSGVSLTALWSLPAAG